MHVADGVTDPPPVDRSNGAGSDPTPPSLDASREGMSGATLAASVKVRPGRPKPSSPWANSAAAADEWCAARAPEALSIWRWLWAGITAANKLAAERAERRRPSMGVSFP